MFHKTVNSLSMPTNDVKWGMVLLRRKQPPVELVDDGPPSGGVLGIAGYWDLKVSGVGQAVGTDRPKFWKDKVTLVQLKDVAPNWALGNVDTVLDAPWDDNNLIRPDKQVAQLSSDIQHAMLRHDEHVAVRRVYGRVGIHVAPSSEDKDAYSSLHGRVTGTGDLPHTTYPVNILVDVKGIPSQLIRDLGKFGIFPMRIVVQGLKRRMRC
jgi:hypothetical protein